jgi:hypothetical protein
MQRILVTSLIFFGLVIGSASAAQHQRTSPGMHHHQRHHVAKYQKPAAFKYKRAH